MPILLNLNQLDEANLRLDGELSVTDLDFGFEDEVVQFSQPLKFRIEAQLLDDSLLVTGDIALPLDCTCVRCLKPFQEVIRLKNWACHIPLKGEDRPPVIKDSVDLTPYIREDMVLALPTHPVCREDCPGLTGKTKQTLRTAEKGKSRGISSPWEELNKLKLKS